ncbi:putative RNA-directed DNA polymerase, eukaryota, reverse transcriptase zinc-binding domain protein [Tanacetum coccineum]
MIFKLNFEKAYDSVNRKYLDYILKQFGFGMKSILFNGSQTSEFSIKRGLRQGDLLSPYLLILIIEGHHHAIKDAIQASLIGGVKVVGCGLCSGDERSQARVMIFSIRQRDLNARTHFVGTLAAPGCLQLELQEITLTISYYRHWIFKLASPKFSLERLVGLDRESSNIQWS